MVSQRLRLFVSVVIPCLGEERTVGTCVRKAQEGLRAAGVAGEVVVSDNGSTDNSVAEALASGARVVHCHERGYGCAVRHGVRQARGDLIVMADADDSYELGQIEPFVRRLIEGADLVMGNRFRGGIMPGAMPWKNRYLGNPVLTGLLNGLFRTKVGDAHCGLRSFTRAAFERMAPTSAGMEFASELVVKAALRRLRIVEVPTMLRPDGRNRPPHLRPWVDGWRHVRYLVGAYIKNRLAPAHKGRFPLSGPAIRNGFPRVPTVAEADGSFKARPCCSEEWEEAYLRYETREEQTRKFIRRLRWLKAATWPRNARVVELCCGRGGGLTALTRLGFKNVEGLDLSASLLAHYSGPVQCYVCDCRALPFAAASRDVLIVQGALHHLEQLPDDLLRTLREASRVLSPRGLFVMVEPWKTPFLSFVHWACDRTWARRLIPKIDALATMKTHEQSTYDRWLANSGVILEALREHFKPECQRIAWGKLWFVGRKKGSITG